MSDLLNLEILTKTFDDQPVGVGIFYIEDLDDLESIRYVYMNKIILYEMRKEKEEVFGNRIKDVAPEAFEHEGGLLVIETYRKIATEGGVVNLGLVEYSNHMVSGTYEISVHHIQPHYVYVMLRNVTELERTKNELEIKNKELEQLVGMVSHDFKEPLRTILAYIQLIDLIEKENLDEKTKTYLSFIKESAERMNTLTSDLLDLNRIGQSNEVTNIDCEKIIDDIQSDLAHKIENSGAKISKGPLPVIKGYASELQLLFQNLISNAIKFIDPNTIPEIHIEAIEKNGWTFSVKDNGIGIEEEYQEKIFDSFERLHSRSTYEGNGIGLAHCKKIIDLHHGKIWVESKLGEGSTFFFTIPNEAP